MSAKSSTEKTPRRKLFLPTLGLAIFSAWLITVTFQLLLFQIAHSFNVPVGTAGLVAAVGSISGIIAGLLLSVLSVRINHKLLLLIGVLFTCFAALGFFFAPNFIFVLITNIGVGTGIAVVSSMAYSLIGEFYPVEKRGRAIGWMVASIYLSICSRSPNYRSNCKRWKLAFSNDLVLSTSSLDKLNFSIPCYPK